MVGSTLRGYDLKITYTSDEKNIIIHRVLLGMLECTQRPTAWMLRIQSLLMLTTHCFNIYFTMGENYRVDFVSQALAT